MFLLELIQWIVVVIFAIRILVELYRYFNAIPFRWYNDGNQWAVITGGNDGIGFEFAQQLANKGYNLMLISRNDTRLNQARTRILNNLNSDTKIEIRTLAVDFSKLDIYDKVEEFIQPKVNDVYILVNNVGAAPSIPDYFTNEDTLHHDELINVNVVTITKLIEIILPMMVEKKRGLIISVTAIWARYLAPMWSMHSATKSYMAQLCQCLAEEYDSSGIAFCTLYTGGVSTKMAHNVRPNITIPRAECYVQSVLKSIKRCGNNTWTGYWSHELIHYWFEFMSMLGTKQVIGEFLHWFTRKYRALLLKRKSGNPLEINVRNLLES